jgi:hypothetical protein
VRWCALPSLSFHYFSRSPKLFDSIDPLCLKSNDCIEKKTMYNSTHVQLPVYTEIMALARTDPHVNDIDRDLAIPNSLELHPKGDLMSSTLF